MFYIIYSQLGKYTDIGFIMFSKIKIIIVSILVITIISLFALWRNTSIKLDNTCKLLTTAEMNLQALQAENAKLLEYNLKKQEEIKQIKNKYEQILNNIPFDECGNAKPSLELLQFLRENYNE